MNPILQNLILGIAIAAPLGPATVTIIKGGLQGGFSAAFQIALGVITADTTYVFLAYFGLSSFITIPAVKTVILVFGMAVLLFLGVQTIRDSLAANGISIASRQVSKNLFLQGYLINISNPLAIVWWLGVIGSTLATSGQESANIGSLLLTLVIVVGILIWHTGLSIVSHFSKQIFNSNLLKIISLASGLFLIGFALRFGYTAYLSLK